MSPETIALILTTITTIAAAVKAHFEAKKAKFEAERANKAEVATESVVRGVEKFKQTVHKDYSQLLLDEIKSSAEADGSQLHLDKVVTKVKNSNVFDREELMRKLEE